MVHPLDVVVLKIKRAREHFDELASEITAFLQPDTYEVVPRFDEDSGFQLFRLVAKKEVPPRVGILVGESLQQLRSALDHIAWQLALLTTDDPPSNTEFPVYKDRDGKRGYCNNRERKIGAIPSDAKTVIDGMQPYLQPSPKEDPLWMLHRLANDDKHRLSHVVSAVPHGLIVERPAGVDLFFWLHTGPFDDDTDVVGVKVHPPNDPRMEVQVGVGEIVMCFGPAGAGRGRPVLALLDEFGRGLDATVAAFWRFFP